MTCMMRMIVMLNISFGLPGLVAYRNSMSHGMKAFPVTSMTFNIPPIKGGARTSVRAKPFSASER